ncbi:MAG: AAA family ATPase [Clostridium sp.]
MKPIKLKIKGLNSFIEEQTVDFETLTDRGLFGIFGPTGSGKSTILDGITLALYGKVARNSSNFINTNCKTMSVSYEFQISGKEVKRYIVQREFKRDNKTGGCTHGKVKLLDVTNGEDNLEVLADKVGAVNSRCTEIIGLGIDDFTRTVVLPQGKFSEFLNLEGKNRRDMLERLFNLQKYGDILSSKLSSRMGKIRTENSELIGKLSGYEGISEEALEIKKDELKKKEADRIILENGKKIIDEKFQEGQEVWNYQLELIDKKREEEALISRQEDMNILRKNVERGEGALKVNPYLLTYENTLKKLEETKKNISLLKIREEELKKLKDEAENTLNFWRKERDLKLPELKIKEQRVKDAILEKRIIEDLEKEIKGLNTELSALGKKYKEEEKRLEDGKKSLEELSELMKLKEKRLDEIKLEDGIKEKVQEGLLLTERFEGANKNFLVNERKLNEINNEIINGKKVEEEVNKSLDQKSKFLNEGEEKLKTLVKNCPGEQKDLLDLHVLLSDSKEKWKKFNELTKEIEEISKECVSLNSALLEDKRMKSEIDNNLISLEENYKKITLDNLANTLRRELKDGEECPVCGGTHHPKKEVVVHEADELKLIEGKINECKLKQRELEQKITRNETTLNSKNEIMKKREDELRGLGEEFKKTSVLELENKFNTLNKSITEYSKSKEEIEKAISLLKEDVYELRNRFSSLKARREENEKQLLMISKEKDDCEKSLNEVKLSLNDLKKNVGVNDFKEKALEINKIERERESLTKEIKGYRVKEEELRSFVDDLAKENKKIFEAGTEMRGALREKENNKNEKIQAIKNKLSEFENLEGLLKDINNEILKLEESFKKSEDNKERVEKEYKECNERLISLISNEKILTSSSVDEKEKLSKAMEVEGFTSIDEIKDSILSREEISLNKNLIEQFNESLSKVKGTIESITLKLKGRSLSEEAWENIKLEKSKKEEEIKLLDEEKGKLLEEVKFILKKLEELKDLNEQKKEIEHKLALLSDLDKLFKGKKFVEYIATTQLKYVSIEASKKLKDISGGNYGLEVDVDGRFIIRDYKNGGAERDASTLSGGETFLASLSLALALSSQIQLKGTAPLELFFLDEGFGTLDDNLLEVVMGSLEKIHNDKLKIGLISHVESIKNRVPVKLVITPAEAGRGGSKVKIERS